VITGPGAGSKLNEAERRGVPTMDEEAFVDFLSDRASITVDEVTET
jgi:NAD-dependent DNA ligase